MFIDRSLSSDPPPTHPKSLTTVVSRRTTFECLRYGTLERETRTNEELDDFISREDVYRSNVNRGRLIEPVMRISGSLLTMVVEIKRRRSLPKL